MFVTDVCCRESEMYNSRETAIVGDLPGNIDGDLFARKIRKLVPVAVYPFSLSTLAPFFARNAFISSFMVHRRVFFCDGSLEQNAQTGNILIFAIDRRIETGEDDAIHVQSDSRINLLTVKVIHTQCHLLKMILLFCALVCILDRYNCYK